MVTFRENSQQSVYMNVMIRGLEEVNRVTLRNFLQYVVLTLSRVYRSVSLVNYASFTTRDLNKLSIVCCCKGLQFKSRIFWNVTLCRRVCNRGGSSV